MSFTCFVFLLSQFSFEVGLVKTTNVSRSRDDSPPHARTARDTHEFRQGWTIFCPKFGSAFLPQTNVIHRSLLILHWSAVLISHDMSSVFFSLFSFFYIGLLAKNGLYFATPRYEEKSKLRKNLADFSAKKGPLSTPNNESNSKRIWVFFQKMWHFSHPESTILL